MKDKATLIVSVMVQRMYEDALREVNSPDWRPPENMRCVGNPPPEVLAQALVQLRLHMSTHNN